MAEHAAGNYRVLTNIGYELLTAAAEREAPRIDEKLIFEVVAPQPTARVARRK